MRRIAQGIFFAILKLFSGLLIRAISEQFQNAMQIFMTPIHQSLGPESIEGDCISKSEARDFEKKQAISERI